MGGLISMGNNASHLAGIARRWLPEHAGGRRAVTGIALNLVPAAFAVACYAAIGPTTDWGDPAVLVVLAIVAVLASAAEVRLKQGSTSFFDPSIVLAMVALAFAGPLPALVIWAIPAMISVGVMRRVPLLSPGVVVTITGYAFGLLAAYGLLSLADGAALGAQTVVLFGCGLVMWLTSFGFANVLYAPFYEGYSVRSLVRTELLELAPSVVAMLALGAASWLLTVEFGILGLAPLAIAAVLPQLAIAAVRSNRSVARLGSREASALYADAIADVMELDRRDRRALALAAHLPAYRTPARPAELDDQLARWTSSIGESLRGEMPLEAAEARLIALRAHDRYDGSDWPAGMALMTPAPRTSRILGCARAWSELTTGMSPLSHSQALSSLWARAGTDLDPAVVAAAGRVVAQEEPFAVDRAFQPRLHRLPRPFRRIAPALVARVSSSA